MGLKENLIKLLTTFPVTQINFTIQNIRVYPSGFALVAEAIRRGSIIIIATEASSSIAEYSSNVGDDHVGRLHLPFPNQRLGLHGNALVVHEAPHALFDYNRLEIPAVDGEIAAYVAQTMYYYLSHVNIRNRVSSIPALTLVFQIAELIVECQAGGLTPPPNLIQSLGQAILSAPLYRDIANQTLRYDGIPSCWNNHCVLR